MKSFPMNKIWRRLAEKISCRKSYPMRKFLHGIIPR
jgi:hypothetical protein